MAAVTTKVGICNLALGWLRANLIVDLDNDTSVEAKLCRANYDRIREAVLEEREWRFATKRAKLPVSTEVPTYGWEFKFKIPSDCLRVLTVSANVSGHRNQSIDNNIEWEREEDFVFTDRSQCFIRYTQNIETPTKFSPGFVQALATRIAAEIAIALTGSRKRHDELMKEYMVKVAVGSTKDGMQGKSRQRRPGRLQAARYRGGGGFETITDV